MLVPTQRMFEKHTTLIIPQDAYFMEAALTIHTTEMYIPQGIAIDGTNVYVKLQNVLLHVQWQMQHLLPIMIMRVVEVVVQT